MVIYLTKDKKMKLNSWFQVQQPEKYQFKQFNHIESIANLVNKDQDINSHKVNTTH